MTELTVLRDDVEWSTRLDGKISEVEIDGRKISDVHDLTQKVIKMTKTIKVLATTALALCVMSVAMAVFTTHWLLSHEAGIEQLLLTDNKETEFARLHQRHRAWVHLEELHGLSKVELSNFFSSHWDSSR